MVVIIQRHNDQNKTIVEALTKVYGIGILKIFYACRLAGVYPFMKVSDVPERTLTKIESTLSVYLTGRGLKQQVQERTKMLLSIGTYRGLRMSQGLPARGQRSHTNAQTARKIGRVKNLYFKMDQGKTSRVDGRASVFDLRSSRKLYSNKSKKKFKRRK